MSDDALATLLEQTAIDADAEGMAWKPSNVYWPDQARRLRARGVVVLPPDPAADYCAVNSTDIVNNNNVAALAAALAELDGAPETHGAFNFPDRARWLLERATRFGFALVVLPPAVAEVLRNREPTLEMVNAAWRAWQNWPGPGTQMECALRAALAVLREPLDKQG